jgi:hypothetical protein
MNAKKLIAAVAVFAAAGSALAGNDAYVDHSGFKSTKTRAEVRAELERDYAKGLVNRSNTEIVEYVNVPSTRSRDEVRQEAIKAAQDKRATDVYFGG